ncbi:MAG: response regulator transcription factor, partial [Bacteroidota bacterium]
TKSLLTKRELEIAKLVCKGYSSNEIAEELHLSVLTVSTHRKHILKKLNVRNPVELLHKLQ